MVNKPHEVLKNKSWPCILEMRFVWPLTKQSLGQTGAEFDSYLTG